MAARYPHLPKANAFPNIESADPFGQYENTFDYDAWKPDVKIRLLSVPWDAGANIVGFADEQVRDAWIDAHTAQALTLTALARIEPAGTLRVPLPFDAAQQHNYVAIDWPEPPVEFGEQRVTRLAYFIDATRYVSPSTTELVLSVDWWQSYSYHMQLSDVSMVRGHYPLLQATADEFLTDKSANLKWLAGAEAPMPDAPHRLINLVSYGINGPQSPAASEVDPAAYMLVMVSTASYPWEIETIPPTTGMPTDWEITAADATPGVLSVIGAPGPHIADVLGTIRDNVPEWLSTVIYAYYIKRELCTDFVPASGAPGGWPGTGVMVQLSTKGQTPRELGLSFSASQVAYPSEYAEIAKLYTWPYLSYEVSDEGGVMVQSVTVESLSEQASYHILRNMSIMQPGVVGWITGIYGDTGTPTAGAPYPYSQISPLGAAQYATMRSWELPTQSIVQGNRNRQQYQDWFGRYSSEQSALAAQNISNRSAEAAKLNADNAATTARQNAYNTADTAYTNTTNAAATGLQNAKNNAANVTRNNAAAVTASANITTNATAQALEANRLDNNKINSDLNYDLNNQAVGFAVENLTTATAQLNNAISNAVGAGSAVISGAVAGAGVGSIAGPIGTAAGAGVGALTAGVNAAATNGVSYITTANSLNVTYSNDATLYLQMQRSMRAKTLNTTSNNTLLTEVNNATMQYDNAQQNAASNTAAANNANLIETNAGNDNQTTLQNAANMRSLSKTNADNSYTLATSSNERTYDASVANALESYNVAHANIERTLRQAGMQAPVTFGAQSQTVLGGTVPRSLIINLRRIDGGAVKTAGDMFLRWGYRWSGYIGSLMPSSMAMGKRLAYWQLATVKATGAYQAARDAVEALLLRGATIWTSPEDITMDGAIYDN